MVNQKLKDKKKKAREKVAKAKVLLRRNSIQNERKKALEQQVKEAEAQEIVNGKLKPYRRPVEVSQEELQRRASVTAQLERNMKLLEALEAEHKAEEAARSEINSKLEGEGYNTMKEKMDALHQKALELTGKAESFVEATDEYNENLAAQQNIEKENQQN